MIWIDENVHNTENTEMQQMFMHEAYINPKGERFEGGRFNLLFGVRDSKASGNFVCVTDVKAALKAINKNYVT